MKPEILERIERWVDELECCAHSLAQADLQLGGDELDRLVERQQFVCDALGRHAGEELPTALLERIRSAKARIDAAAQAAQGARDQVAEELRRIRDARAHAQRRPPREPAFVSRRA